jgi:hypothetical protein
MAAATRRLELTLLSERFAISRLAGGAPIPEWALPTLLASIAALERAGDTIHRSKTE